MASSTITGIGSGFDTIGIVKALVDAERAPKFSQITKLQTSTTTQLSAVGTVKASLEAFRTAIGKLSGVANFNGLVATSSDEKISKVTIDDKASAGKYALDVTTLATASKVTSKVFEGGGSAVVNAGTESTTLTISQSDSDYDVVIPAGATLQQTRDAINTQLQSKGISANVLSDANGARLVISSQTTGKGTDITIGGNSELSTGYDAGKPPVNAVYSIDGIAMESSSNKVTSAISGVTLELIDTKPSTINVVSNTDTLKTSVQSFVSAYNALMTSINGQTKVSATGDAATTTSGALTGDASMRQLVSGIRNELLQNSSESSVGNLSQMGISTDVKTGLLTLDDSKWNAAVATKNGPAEIAKVFTGTTGLVARMNKATEAYVGTTGLLAARATDLNDKLTDLTTQVSDLDRRMEALKTTLTAKYTAMDGMIAKINASSSSIMTTLNSLNNRKSD